MIEVEPGEAITRCAADVHEPGVGPVTSGAVVTFRFLDAADAQSGATFTAVHSGGGTWCADLTAPTVDGFYLLENAIAYGGEEVKQFDRVRVGAAMNRAGHSLSELRAAIGRIMGELTPVVATGGSVNTIQDTRNLYDDDDSFEGQEIVFTSAAAGNIGKVNRVIGNDMATATLTFYPDLPDPIVAGDRAEIYNLRGIGIRVHEIDGALNDAIKVAAGMGGQRLAADLSAFSEDTPYATIPAVFDWIIAVEVYSANGEWVDVTRSLANRGGGFALDRANRRIELIGAAARRADGYQIRVRGLGRPTPLLDPEDRTMVDYEWITKQAIASLLWTKYTRDPSLERAATTAKEDADAIRAKCLPGRRANAIRVGR